MTDLDIKRKESSELARRVSFAHERREETNSVSSRRVLITGGHFTPGLAIIPVLEQRGWEVIWVGVERALTGTSAKTLEVQVLPNFTVSFYSLKMGKFHRHSLLANLENIWKIPQGLIQGFHLVSKIKPDVVLSFGSYVSVPVCLAAWIKGIPIVIHEQTAASGLANRLVGKFAAKIAISFPSGRREFPQDKTVFTGNLVRKSFFVQAAKKTKQQDQPVILITGGSRGSQVINLVIAEIVKDLLSRFEVIHQVGQLDYPKFAVLKEQLGSTGGRYRVVPNFNLTDMERAFGRADLVISRSGANTVSEIAVMGVPAILIPLPFSERDEQTKNAQILENVGLAKIIKQEDLTAQTLLEQIEDVFHNLSNYKKKATRAKGLVPEDAPERLVEVLEEVVSK